MGQREADIMGLVESESGSEESAEEAEDGNAFVANFKLLKRNPQLLKVLIVAGLQQGSSNLCATFVLSEMKAKFWGTSMSEYQAIASIMINAVAVICGGPYGRFSDAVDRRLAAGIFAAGTFLPGWSLLVFGATSSGLWISTVAQIIGSFGLTSNVMFALASDVTPFQDRELMAGAFFAFLCFANVLLIALPVLFILVLEVVPNNPVLIIWLQTGLTVLCLVTLFFVHDKKEDEKDHDNHMWAADIGATAPSDDEEAVIDVAGNGEAPAKKDYKAGLAGLLKGFAQPMLLACGHRRLRRLCLAAFLLSFAGNLVSDIGGQFFNQTLGLLEHPDHDKIIMVSVYSMLPGQLMAIPGNLITGYLAKQSGPLKLLRKLVPFAAVLVAVGGFMAVVQQMWYIAVVVICLTYANLPNVPLQRIVAGVAPPGRTGEALGTVGVFAQCASLIGNVAVAMINPWLLTSGLPNPLWVYYPACGGMVMLALLPLLGSPKGGWGTASGKLVDTVHAFLAAAAAEKRWQRFVWRKRQQRGEAITPAQAQALADMKQTRARDAAKKAARDKERKLRIANGEEEDGGENGNNRLLHLLSVIANKTKSSTALRTAADL